MAKSILFFFKNATGEDIILGVFNALILHKNIGKTSKAEQSRIVEDDSYKQSAEMFPALLEKLHSHGWSTSTKTTSIESRDSFRLSLESKNAGKDGALDSS